MTTTTEASTERAEKYFRQACAAHYAYGAIDVLLKDENPPANVTRAVLRDILAEFRRAGVDESA